MLDLFDYNDIIYHIKNYSKIYKPNSTQNWIQILCPYCDDALRKNSSSHGHFYISRYFNFGQCFRCDTKTSIKKLLLDINFENKTLLNNIFQNTSNINYSSEFKKGYYNKGNIEHKHAEFQKTNAHDYQLFINYLYSRVGNIDFNQFLVYPTYIENKLCVAFNNKLDEVSSIRFIENNNIKYFKLSSSVNYFFQEPDIYNNIVLCEGAFDLINLYKYSTLFDPTKTFYIAINGRSYISDLTSIIINNFMIGSYIINIVLDSDVKDIIKLKKQLQLKVNLLNPTIIINFYIPTISKDVSEFNQIQLM